MKNLERHENKKGIRHNSWRTYALAIVTALSLNFNACKAPKLTDIVKDKKNIETVSNKINFSIEKRRELVGKYNEYLRLTGTPGHDNLEFENAKAQLYEKIVDMDKDIVKLLKKKGKLDKKLTKDQLKSLEQSPNPDEPMDPDKFGFI